MNFLVILRMFFMEGQFGKIPLLIDFGSWLETDKSGSENWF